MTFPSGWDTPRARFVFSRRDVRGVDAPLASATKDGVTLRSDLEFSVWNPDSNVSNYKLVEPEDFVIGLRSFQHGISHSNVRGIVSPAYTVLRGFPGTNPGFFKYYFRSGLLISQLANITQGIRQGQAIDIEAFQNLIIPLPPLEEQRRIADFLDVETARIDQLLQLRKRQLELWAERVDAFTHRQVTDSSGSPDEAEHIDWLGPIPHGWLAPPIGRVARFVMGTTFPLEYQGKRDGDFPFIKVSDFQSADAMGRMTSAENWINTEESRKLGARVVPPGAILYARVGAALLLNRRRITTRPSVIDDNVRAICFTHGDPRFWAGVLSLLDMGQLVNPGPVPSISESQVSPIRVPDPGAAAQRPIADRLERNVVQWNQARSLVEFQIKLLTERRQALITAAVTGQFDVSTASGRNVTDGVPA
ncbi:restriction endonuclease subunit S [Streptomyces avermitilis]